MSQKIRAVYDALDHGNHKNAIKLCTAFLQKQPGHALCKALHAVALERCGRHEEALALCEEVVSSASSIHDTVMNTLQVVYRRCRAHEKIARMYDEAWTRDPDDEDTAVALFIISIRMSDFGRSQQVATKLYRKFNKPKYLHWVVSSILLQTRGAGPSKVVDLASMMIQKAPINMDVLKEDGTMPYNRSQHYLLLLHLAVLRKQQKYQQALEMLEACKKLIKMPNDLAELRVQLLVEANDLARALQDVRAKALQNPQCLRSAQAYIQLAFRCQLQSTSSLPVFHVELPTSDDARKTVDVPDHGARVRDLPEVATLEDVIKHSTDDEVFNALVFFRHLLKKAQTAGGSDAQKGGCASAERVPRLAELEIRRRLFCENEAAVIAADPISSASVAGSGWKAVVADEDLRVFMGLVGEYLVRFGTLLTCFFDLKPYLSSLPESDVTPLLEGMRSALGVTNDVSAAWVTFNRIKNACCRGRDLDTVKSAANEALGLLRSLVTRVGPGEAEVTPRMEEAVLLTLVSLVEMDRSFCRHACTLPLDEQLGFGIERRPYMLDAIAVAQIALTRFPHCFHLRVMLVLLYGNLGLSAPLLQYYAGLEIKNIQHESLSHLAMDALCAVGGGGDGAREVFGSIVQIHEDVEKDISQALSMAFHNGVYHRVPEYVESVDRINRSVVWGRATVEETLYDIGQAQALDGVTEALGRQFRTLDSIARRPVDAFAARNQDRALLNGLHSLPLMSPLAVERSASGSSSGSSSAPTLWERDTDKNLVTPSSILQASAPLSRDSSAVIWETTQLNNTSDIGRASPASSLSDVSAFEELLTRHAYHSAALVNVSTSLLSAMGALLRREADEQRITEALDASKASLALMGVAVDDCGENVGTAATPAGVASATAAAGDDSKRGSSAVRSPWGDQISTLAQSWGVAHRACEVARLVLRSVASGSDWEGPDRHLAGLIKAATDLTSSVHAADLAPGSTGTSRLWPIVNCFTSVVIPVALWLTTAVPKTSGKKVKEGQEALHATRIALRGLLACLQSGLADLQTELDTAQATNAGVTRLPEGLATAAFGNTAEPLDDIVGLREKVWRSIADAQQKHLQAVRDLIINKMTLLKSRGAFKP
eukprot:TRINITY_DN6261_c0_g1_i1.p1 TRINITY_DN6261_c0_g1~~TRINITY_DN6261_c0_g1_i1.p1  ORF type:complete len:1113 (+),score=203.32 TRINITY_DN6261_c0_g1_i1:84-3422(+)